jgi:glycosyltransferase involved in cell wall biosynthesis
MSARRRLSVCYVVPGHDLLSSSGPTRNVLNLAAALSRQADVTVAFRRLAEPVAPDNVRTLQIQGGGSAASLDDAATSGIGYREFLLYLRALRQFVHVNLRSFDIVLEKSWLLSGYLSSLCRERGQLGVPIENIVPDPRHAARGQLGKRVRISVGRWIAGRELRRAPLIIAETEFLKKEIAQYWRVAGERIAVVDLGVDRSLFAPREHEAARQRFGIAPDKTVLSYVGVLDWTHNLEPALRALAQHADPNMEMHIVGDGERGEQYRELAKQLRVPVVFHGRVPHREVPWYIAAADLCLAPYDPAAFSSGELGYSTMKIPEYMSTGRAVVSVPSGRIRSLVKEGETGFLFDNRLEQWQSFLRQLPSRERLREMGAAASRVKLPSWDDTASAYLDLCWRQLEAGRGRG